MLTLLWTFYFRINIQVQFTGYGMDVSQIQRFSIRLDYHRVAEACAAIKLLEFRPQIRMAKRINYPSIMPIILSVFLPNESFM
ncbi:hypothetical protein TWF102_002874 [Orbilia oligospora]|uniref:Uncharacterized protein n=1 Tax=Orbilia oligospora TaxID=2813651 RepID=A0A7C8N317_ORBOL|nr:hypothetical protein TWF102_002874 [Orbilia oligospora]